MSSKLYSKLASISLIRNSEREPEKYKIADVLDQRKYRMTFGFILIFNVAYTSKENTHPSTKSASPLTR